MKKTLFLLFFTTLLAACTRGDNPAAVGEHNLSKGSCENITIDGKTYHEAMTQTHCEMVNGKFIPRDLKRFVWF